MSLADLEVAFLAFLDAHGLPVHAHESVLAADLETLPA
jgi:hypothetical protein